MCREKVFLQKRRRSRRTRLLISHEAMQTSKPHKVEERSQQISQKSKFSKYHTSSVTYYQFKLVGNQTPIMMLLKISVFFRRSEVLNARAVSNV